MLSSFKKLLVEEYTTPNPITVESSTKASEIAKIMEENGIRHVPVVEKNAAVGIISDRDIRVVLNAGAIDALKARDFMTQTPYIVSGSTPLHEVAFEMSKKKIGSALVTEESGAVAGIFTSTDALNALIEVLRGDVE